jgi:hypothetical protein
VSRRGRGAFAHERHEQAAPVIEVRLADRVNPPFLTVGEAEPRPAARAHRGRQVLGHTVQDATPLLRSAGGGQHPQINVDHCVLSRHQEQDGGLKRAGYFHCALMKVCPRAGIG